MAYPKGTYNIDVTITQGCTIEFQIPSAASSWVHVNPQSGGSGRYVLTIDDGNHGDTTVEVYVNGNHCSSRDIAVTSPPVVTCGCGDLTIPETSYTWSATDDSSKKHSFTISSASCITNITKSSLTHFDAVFESGKVTVNPKGTNTGQQPYNDILTISYKADSSTCTSAITLTQNAPSCQQNSCTCYLVGAISYPSSSDTRATVSWPYSAITWTTASTCDVTSALTTTNTSSTTVTYDPASCDKWIQSGTITWTGYKTCGNKSCSSSDVTLSWSVDQGKPAGCDCGCGDLTVEAPSNIQAEGGSVVSLGRITPGCVENVKITSITYNGSESGWITATTSADSITSAFELTGNVADWSSETGSQPRTATVTVTGKTTNNPNCSTSYTITQEAAGCTCQNGFGGATAQTLPTKIVGGDEITVWKVEKTCGQLYAITEGNCIASSGVSENGGYYYITAKTSDVSSSCNFKVGYQLKVNGEICTDATGMSDSITVEPAIECDCSDLMVVTSNGEPVDWGKDIILTSVDEEYTFTYIFNQGKEACFEGTNVTFSYDSTDAEYFIISTGTTGGKSYIKIKPNPNKDPNQIDIYFDYTLSDGTDCSTQWGENFITVIYNPACKCEELLPDDACIQRQVSTAAGTYPLGTFGVVGCGEFSGISTSSQVDKVIITESDDGYDVSVKLYEFTPTTSQPDAPIDIDIFSLESGQALADCHHVYRIWQKKDYVNCARVRKINFVDDNPAYTSNVNAYLAKLDDNDGFIAFSALSGSNIITSFSTEHDWIDASTINPFDIGSTIYLRGKIETNPSAQPRTNTITINYDKEKLRQIYGICEDCINQPFTVTVTQKGDESLNCNCLDLKDVEIRYFGDDTSFNSDNVRNDCFVSTGLKFTPIGDIVPGYESAFNDPSAFFTEDNYVAVNDWLSINLDVRSYTTSPEKCYLHVAYKALANTGSERGYTFKIKLNYDPAKQSEECIWEIKFTQEAVIDVTCQQLLDSIQTYSMDTPATYTRDSVAYMRPVLRNDVRLSGVTVQSQECGDASWITKIEPGDGANTNVMYMENTENKSTERDHSTTSRCAKISVFFIDSEGNRLKINGVECGEKEITVTQKGYSGDCMACTDATPILPGPNFAPYRDTTYESGGETFSAFYEGDGESDRPLYEVPIPYSYYYDGTNATRCFDLIADTTHHGSFTPYDDGKYLHVELDESNKKWIIHGKIKPTSEPFNTVAVEVYLQRRNLAEETSTQCGGTAYIVDFVILKRQ